MVYSLINGVESKYGCVKENVVRMWVYVIIKPLMGDCVMSFDPNVDS